MFIFTVHWLISNFVLTGQDAYRGTELWLSVENFKIITFYWHKAVGGGRPINLKKRIATLSGLNDATRLNSKA